MKRQANAKHGIQDDLYYDFTPGQRVMTREGFPGTVMAVESGMIGGNENYQVVLDSGMGGGDYSAGELRPLNQTGAARSEAVVDHTAADDYPELGNILTERPPLEHVTTASVRNSLEVMGAYDDPDSHLDTDDLLGLAEDDPEAALPFTFSDDELSVEGAANILEGHPIKNFFLDHTQTKNWCRFRRDEHCWYPKKFDVKGTKLAGYPVFTPVDRGVCPRVTWDLQKNCNVGYPGPDSHDPARLDDGTHSWEDGGQKMRMSSLASDGEWGFHFTASWSDVRSKAKQIRADGGVHIIRAGLDIVAANVQGEHEVYQTVLTRQPGRPKVLAFWECGCKWAQYSWGRSGPFRKYEGRMCSHALATYFAIQSGEMNGGQLKETPQAPHWMDPTVKVVQPSNHPKYKPGRYSSLAHNEYDPEDGDDMSPALILASGMLQEGVDPVQVVANLRSMGALNANAVLHTALTFKQFVVKVRNMTRVLVGITDDNQALLSDGTTVAPSEVLYPTYTPDEGLRISGSLNVTADGRDLGAAARAMLTLSKRYEPATTAAMTSLASKYGGQMEGLDYRIKGEDRLKEKMGDETHLYDHDAGRTAAHMSDVLRYTMKTGTNDYTGMVTKTLDDLKKQGYKARQKNFWQQGDPYQGFNVAMRNPQGHPFELQFHTPESLGVKTTIHHDYEEFRHCTDPARRKVLWDKMCAEANKIPVPKGILDVPNLKMQTLTSIDSGNGTTYHVLTNFEDEPIGLMRTVISPDDAHCDVLKDDEWVMDNNYARYPLKGETGANRVDDSMVSTGMRKSALKSFSADEQREIIEEGLDVEASNLDRLDIAGTHYEALANSWAAQENNLW